MLYMKVIKSMVILRFKIYGESSSQRAPKFGPEGDSQLPYIYFIKYVNDFYCKGTLMWGS